MTFFSKQNIGRVYLIKIVLPGNVTVFKIGMCHSSRSVDRMMEILRSWFSSYRFVPYAELKLDMETNYPKEVEAHIHNTLNHKRWIPDKKVSGGTEMFTEIDELRVIQYLKHCSNSITDTSLDLSTVDYRNLGQFLSP